MSKRVVFAAAVFWVLGLWPLSPGSFCAELPADTDFEEAGVTEKRVIDELQKTLEDAPEIPEIEEERPKKREGAVPELRFFVRAIAVEGNTIIPSSEFQDIVQGYENREVTVSELNELAARIEKIYRDSGFITAYVYVPPQKVENEKVLIRVIEGKVARILVEGNRHYSTDTIVALSGFKQGEVLKYDKLRGALRNINRNPDLSSRVILSAGEAPETTDVTFKVTDRFPVHFGASADNYGNESAGKEHYGFSARHNNLTGIQDILLTGVVFARDLGVGYAQYLAPIRGSDFKFVGGASCAQAVPQKELEPLGVNSTSQTYFGRVRKTIFQTDSVFIDADFGMDVKESRTKVLSGTFRRNRLRIFRLKPELVVLDSQGYTRFESDFGFSTKGLGAAVHTDPEAARQGVDASFFRYHGSVTRSQKTKLGHRYMLKSDFQVSSNKLPAEEAFYMGGASSVRGYPEGDYLADGGFFINFDYFMPLPLVPADWKLPYSSMPLKQQVEWVAFVDEGYGRVRGPSALETKERHMAGIGTGLKIQIQPHVFARLEWGFAIGDDPRTEGGRSQFNFRIQFET